jgi:hypothetical protein
MSNTKNENANHENINMDNQPIQVQPQYTMPTGYYFYRATGANSLERAINTGVEPNHTEESIIIKDNDKKQYYKFTNFDHFNHFYPYSETNAPYNIDEVILGTHSQKIKF